MSHVFVKKNSHQPKSLMQHEMDFICLSSSFQVIIVKAMERINKYIDTPEKFKMCRPVYILYGAF